MSVVPGRRAWRAGRRAAVFIVTLLVTGVLIVRHVRGAILIGLVTGTVGRGEIDHD